MQRRVNERVALEDSLQKREIPNKIIVWLRVNDNTHQKLKLQGHIHRINMLPLYCHLVCYTNATVTIARMLRHCTK